MTKPILFARLCKIDEALQEIWGVATEEVIDAAGEIFDYESSKPLFEEWSNHAYEVSGGKSRGNLREMHGLTAAGKVMDIEFDDAAKRINIHGKIVDSSSWAKVKEGVLIGLSIGGSYTKRWLDDKAKDVFRFTARPSEISVVDLPCVPTALIHSIKGQQVEFVKSDGTISHITAKEVPVSSLDTQKSKPKSKTKTKRVDGEDLPASAFLIVSDKTDTSTWKLPVRFSTDDKIKSHIRNALARFSALKDVSAEQKKKAWSKLTRLCREHGIEVESEKTMTGSISKSQVEAAKSMYTVCNFADVLSTIRNMQSSCEYEGDYENDERDYALAEKLHEWLTEGVDIFQLMVEDETSELVAAAKAAGGNIMEKAKKMTLAAHFKKAAAGHEKMAEVHADKAAAHEDMMEACKCAMGKADVGDTGSDKEVMSALHSGHKSMAKAEHAMSKVHAGLAEHCTKMAEGYEGGEDAPSDKQPADTKKAEEAEVEKAAAAKAAADLELKKAADAKSAADADALTKAIEAAVAPFKAKVEELEGKLTKANEPTPPPSGLTFIPRDVAKSMSAVTVSDSDNGL